MTDYFSIMPVEIFADDRLTKTDIRVLGVIMSWRNKTTNLCHPSREQISERCGLSVSKISTSTTHLVELGWLEKKGNGGRSSHCVYKFCIPQTVPDLETVPKSVTVPNSVTKTVPDLVTKTVPDLGRGNKLKDNLNKTEIYIKEKSRKTLTDFPNNFEVTLEMCEWAVEEGIPESRVMHETQKFKDNCLAKGLRYKDWIATWRNWMRNAVNYNYKKTA